MAEPARTNPNGTPRAQATLFDVPPAGADCSDESPTGRKSTRYDYVLKTTNNGGRFYQECEPWLYGSMQVDNLNITVQATAPTFNGNLNGVASGNKTLAAFDIPHVMQQGKRIRHIVAEGPEPGIYIRGKLSDSNVIELPEYWEGLIDPESITVTLTQIGYSQDLIVEGIEWGKRVKIKSGNGANINCYYEVWAARWVNPMDHSEELHVVYEGKSPDDYPGNKSSFLVGGWDYDRRSPEWG